jgi:hypothetical protein
VVLEKLICSQCGSNELQPFGASAFKCESCGTILKVEDKPQAPSPPPVPSTAQPKPFRSGRQFTVLDDEDGFSPGTDLEVDAADPQNKIVLIIVILIAGAVLGLLMLFSK